MKKNDKNYEIEMFEECLMKEIGPKDYECYEKKLAETVKEEFLKDAYLKRIIKPAFSRQEKYWKSISVKTAAKTVLTD